MDKIFTCHQKYKIFKSTNSVAVLKTFKQFRIRVVNELRERKKIYYNQYFDENKNNIKMLWKGIKSIVNLMSNNPDAISYIEDYNGIRIKDLGEVANNLNYFFSNVSTDIAKKIPRTNKSPLSYLSNPNSASFSPCISDEVTSIIQSRKNGKSCGSNSIPIKLLKILNF